MIKCNLEKGPPFSRFWKALAFTTNMQWVTPRILLQFKWPDWMKNVKLWLEVLKHLFVLQLYLIWFFIEHGHFVGLVKPQQCVEGKIMIFVFDVSFQAKEKGPSCFACPCGSKLKHFHGARRGYSVRTPVTRLKAQLGLGERALAALGTRRIDRSARFWTCSSKRRSMQWSSLAGRIEL